MDATPPDTGRYYELKLLMDQATNRVMLYRDGMLKAVVPKSSFMPYTYDRIVWFGDGSGAGTAPVTSHWNYVAFDAAYKPPRQLIDWSGPEHPTNVPPAAFLPWGYSGTPSLASGTDTVNGVEYPYWELNHPDGHYDLVYYLHSKDLTGNWDLRAKLRVLVPTTSAWNAHVAVADNQSKLAAVGLRSDGYYYVASGYVQTQLEGFTLDTNRYYEVRIQKDAAAGTVAFYLDGALKLTVSVSSLPDYVESRLIMFADGTGGGGASVVRWSKLEFYPNGKPPNGTFYVIR